MRTLSLLPLISTSFLLLSAQEPPLRLAEAEARFLEAFDLREGASKLKLPPVRPVDRAALRWLAETAESDHPINPFPKGSRDWKEAESIRALLDSAPEVWLKRVVDQKLRRSGSCLAFWRWGQARVRQGKMNPELRRAWEDHLLASHPPALVMGYTLRHALCFALAEGDEARFSALKERWSELDEDLFMGFQRAFAMLGAPSPRFRVWRLPEMGPDDLTFSEMGGGRIWIAADEGLELPTLEPGTAWIVPTVEGSQPEGLDSLEASAQTQAQNLSRRLQAAGRKAFLAPARKPFESCALVYFPICVDMKADGSVGSIRMGDAALASNRTTPVPPPAKRP